MSSTVYTKNNALHSHMYFHSIAMTNNLTPYNSIKVSNFNYWDRTHYLKVLFASTDKTLSTINS